MQVPTPFEVSFLIDNILMKTFSLDLLAPCNEPAAPSFGEKLGKDFRHGHSVTFFCRQGYQIVGAVSITCNDGTWDVQVPVCKG